MSGSFKVTKEKVDSVFRAVLYQKMSGSWVFIEDVDLHSQMSFKEAKESLLNWVANRRF